MMRLLFILFLTLSETCCLAQDQIRLKNKETFAGKILSADRAFVTFIPNQSFAEKRLIINTISEIWIADSSRANTVCASGSPACTLIRKDQLFLVGEFPGQSQEEEDLVTSNARIHTQLKYNLGRAGKSFTQAGVFGLMSFGMALVGGFSSGSDLNKYLFLGSGVSFAVSLGCLATGGERLSKASQGL